MIHVWVLPFGFNELCQHLKSVQQIIIENERSSMVPEVVEGRPYANNLFLDKSCARGPRLVTPGNRPRNGTTLQFVTDCNMISDDHWCTYSSVVLRMSVILENAIPDYFRNMSTAFYRLVL